MADLVMANHINGSSNSTCFQFGVRDVETITKVKILPMLHIWNGERSSLYTF